MTDWHEVAHTSELPIGRARMVSIGEHRIALYHTASGYFATDNTCPHRGGPLGEGDLMGEEIVCPWHLWSFNVQTGVNPGNPESTVTIHEVRIEGDKILVRLSQSPTSDEPEAASQA
jgi:nitrite reductase (NADH) small subunit